MTTENRSRSFEDSRKWLQTLQIVEDEELQHIAGNLKSSGKSNRFAGRQSDIQECMWVQNDVPEQT
jgi:hypothetical protein